MPPNDNTQMTATQQARIQQRQKFAQTVSAMADKELVNLFGSAQGKAAAARVALAFRSAAATAKDPEAFWGCSVDSVAQALATSAFTGIMPGGPFPGCYLIPKKVNGVQTLNWWITHRGIKTLARRAGQGIETLPYFEGDEVVIVRGRDWRVEVIEGPAPDRDDAQALLGIVYWVSDINTGALLACRKMTRAQIGKRWAKSAQRDSGPWAEWGIEMAEKTAIKFAAGRGDVFFDDVGNMALGADVATEMADAPGVTVSQPVTINVPADAARIAQAQPLDIEPTAERKPDPVQAGPTDEERAEFERKEREQAARDAAAKRGQQAESEEGTP